MKLLYCSKCGSIEGLEIKGRYCSCGRCAARWIDPKIGTAIFATEDNSWEQCYCLGIHNALLRSDDYEAWKTADGYLFKQKKSMIIKIKPGMSSDTRFTSFEEVFKK